MSPNAPPDHVRTFALALAVLERRSAIGRPRHLEDTGRSLHAFDSQARSKPTGAEILVELPEGEAVAVAISRGQSFPVAIELASSRVARHGLLEVVEKLVGALSRRDAPFANVLACLSLSTLPRIGPEPGLIGVDELLRPQDDPDILDGDLEDIARIDMREPSDCIRQGQLPLWSEPNEGHA